MQMIKSLIRQFSTATYGFLAVLLKYIQRSISNIVSFRSPSLFYLLTVGVEVVYFHLITHRHTPQSVGLFWTRDRPVAETYT
jgi:hypothetical protein